MALIKNDNKQKKHKGENIIGKIIYGFLLFAPLLNILVTCMYVTFNKNAYLSQTSAYLDKYTEVTSSDQLVENNQYLITYNGDNQAYYNPTKYYYHSINVNWHDYPNTDTSHTYIAFAIRGYGYNGTTQGNNVRLYYDETNYDNTYIWGTQLNEIIFTLKSYSNFNLNTEPHYPYKLYNLDVIYTTDYSMLNNTWEWAINKTEQSNLYNWSKTTGTYTVLHNTCNLLGITNTFTPMLLAYWLIISVIYFIYDIALILVWMVHKKIHELTDAI